MTNFNSLCVTEEVSIREVLNVIDQNKKQLALVVDCQQKLIGSITDGDIRRALLKNRLLEDSISTVMNRNPKYLSEKATKQEALAFMEKHKIHHIPLLNEQKEIIEVLTMEELVVQHKKENWVVLMAGGLGSRLMPLTENTPKPLLRVGGKPIIETIMSELKRQGYYKFIITLNYLGEKIQDYFGDGEAFGVKIKYVFESEKLGTAGPLSLIDRSLIEENIIVMNGDLLTKANFNLMMSFHEESEAVATMGVREFDYQIPFGVISFEEGKIIEIQEKPTKREYVSAGIYVLSPEAVGLVPKGEFFDMPDLFEKIIEEDKGTCVFPIREYWKDVGRIDDFKAANEEYGAIFNAQ